MRDDQPSRRQARRAERKFMRAKASRQGLPYFLLICEGEKTEPSYIRGLCEARRINTANVRIERGGEAGDALSLVQKARALFAKNRDYDRVCVILDHDGQSLEKAKDLAKKRMKTLSGESIEVELILSRPAFEFWLLLHFEYSARPFRTSAEVIRDLRAFLPNYDKADPRIFEQVQGGLERAIVNAERLKRELEQNGATCPDTDLSQLVSQLLAIARN